MAVTTVYKTMLTVPITKETDSSSDWASISNSTYFYDKTDKLVHYKDGSGSVLEIFSSAGGGGLTYFTEAQATTGTNASVYVDSFSATGGTTNVDISLIPKGAGAFLLAIPNGLASGGNKRGQYAVDLQLGRSSASQVASGDYAVTIGYSSSASGVVAIAIGESCIASGTNALSFGRSNTASGNQASCLGGQSNTASGQYSITSGYNNTASGLYGIAIGKDCTATNQSSLSIGLRCKATGENAVCIGGFFYSDSTASGGNAVVLGSGIASGSFSLALGNQNTADGQLSTAYGYGANTFGISGKISYTGYTITSRGDVQDGNIRLIGRTTDATPRTLNSINTTLINTGTQLTLQNQHLITFKGQVTGKQSGSINIGVWNIDGVIVRGANAASTTLVIGNVSLITNASGWGTPTLSADTTNGCLSVQVTGLAGTNIQWSVSINTVENLYL